MSEDTSTTATSEGDPGASGDATAGSAGDGGAGGTQASVGIEDLEALRRDFQSAQDKQIARLEKLLEERAAPAPKDDTSGEPEALTPSEVDRRVAAAVHNATQITAAVGELRTEFPADEKAVARSVWVLILPFRRFVLSTPR